MIFSSFIFLFWFLPLFLAVYWWLPLWAKNLWLTLASFVFYGWLKPVYILLMVGTTLVDYVCARAMGERGFGQRRLLWLWISVGCNLGLLAYFKYFNLVMDTWNSVLAARGVDQVPWERIWLPAGISFYTFQSMSYTIDVYRGEVKPVRSFADLICYVSMFPQLVAGPIVRYRDVQLELTQRTHGLQMFSDGVLRFMIGFAKKILIADNAALFADLVFGSDVQSGAYQPAMVAPGLVMSWTGVVAYAVQIYFDFSGYSDMAIGLGKMLGFRFLENFDSPYRAESITDFWRRWHMSLSTWLRDYLYVPLGGNQRGRIRTFVNLMMTMLLGGLWHGAAWTFVIWGAYQGLFLVFERLCGRRPVYAGLPRALRVACTFIIVLGGWTIFRSSSMHQLGDVLLGMVGGHGVGDWQLPKRFAFYGMVAVPLGLVLAWFAPQARSIVARFHPMAVAGVSLLFLLALMQLFTRDYSPFIYFQF